MSASAISREEVAAILGQDWTEPPVTFASVWNNMKIERVWRRVVDLLPDEVLFSLVVPTKEPVFD